jgi:hypothetical protein
LSCRQSKFWTRKKFKGTNALKKKINPTRIPIENKGSIQWLQNLTLSMELLGEPSRCIHISDRYELFCKAHESGTHFLVRICVDSLAGDEVHTLADEMNAVAIIGLHRVEAGDGKGGTSQAVLEVRYRRIHVMPPIGKQKRYPVLDLAVIHAK